MVTMTVGNVPTLELKNRKKPGGAYSVPIANIEEDANLTANDTALTNGEDVSEVLLLTIPP